MTGRALLLVVAAALVPAAAGCGGAQGATPEGADAAPSVRLDDPRLASWLPDPAARHGSGASAPVPHHDGTRTLHVAARGGRFVLLETARGTEREVLRHTGDVGRAEYLPDGPIVFSGAVDGPSPLAGVGSAWALFVHDPAQGTTRRISFGAGLDADPWVLSDGRIVFSSWRPGTGRLALFTVHPDGTGYAPLHARDDAHLVLPAQDAGTLDVIAWAVPDDAPPERIRIDWDAPRSCAAPDAESAVTTAPRRRPQGHLSSVRDERPWGTLVCVDARANGARDAASARIAAYGAAGRPLGDVPLADDGSFVADVPADTPLLVSLVAADGRVVAAERGPFWVRSNEVRVCVTCHDDFETAPPNRRPAAVLGRAADLRGGTR